MRLLKYVTGAACFMGVALMLADSQSQAFVATFLLVLSVRVLADQG